MNVFLTGGAGYIGSHMVKTLRRRGAKVVVFDNLTTGYRDAVIDAPLIEGDINNREALAAALASDKFDAVMHFASRIQVGESMLQPAKYYETNVCGTLSLLDSMRHAGIRRFIFSSTAAIFGEPAYTPIDEAHPKAPINPYGFSKWTIENVLGDYDRAYRLRSISLRYFNAAGADPDGTLGERHDPETHLIPLVLQAASGRRDAVTLFGTDYPTPDGTCIRDYIHVSDLCEAHLQALERLLGAGASDAYNLGNNQGFSVRQVVESAERVTGKRVPVIIGPRRAGDPAVLVADSKKAIAELGWRPQYSDLDTIVRHAWRWEQKMVQASKTNARGVQ